MGLKGLKLIFKGNLERDHNQKGVQKNIYFFHTSRHFYWAIKTTNIKFFHNRENFGFEALLACFLGDFLNKPPFPPLPLPLLLHLLLLLDLLALFFIFLVLLVSCLL